MLAVPLGAEPGTRLKGCVLRLADARGVARATGGCQVTVGLPSPVLSRPESGVPLGARPAAAGTAHPGARITVSDQDGNEVCTDTAGPDGLWSCAPARDLPDGPNRLQAKATLNGVSATSEQIQISVGSPHPGVRPGPGGPAPLTGPLGARGTARRGSGAGPRTRWARPTATRPVGQGHVGPAGQT